jgi:hypothetical protein
MRMKVSASMISLLTLTSTNYQLPWGKLRCGKAIEKSHTNSPGNPISSQFTLGRHQKAMPSAVLDSKSLHLVGSDEACGPCGHGIVRVSLLDDPGETLRFPMPWKSLKHHILIISAHSQHTSRLATLKKAGNNQNASAKLYGGVHKCGSPSMDGL